MSFRAALFLYITVCVFIGGAIMVNSGREARAKPVFGYRHIGIIPKGQ